MKLQDLNEKQRLALIIGIGVLILAGAIFMLYKTKLKAIKVMKNQVSNLKMKILEVKRAQDDIKKFNAELESIEKTLGEVNQQLPREKELPELLGKLAELASSFPTKDYISVTPRSPEDLDKYYKLPITINLRCTYLNLQNYLQKLEGLPRLVKIDTIQINPNGENPAVLMVNLEMNVYYLKQKV